MINNIFELQGGYTSNHLIRSDSAVTLSARRSFFCVYVVVNISIFQIQVIRLPLKLKYACPAQSTWKLAVESLLKIIDKGLTVYLQAESKGANYILLFCVISSLQIKEN